MLRDRARGRTFGQYLTSVTIVCLLTSGLFANDVFVGYVGGSAGMRRDSLLRFGADGGLQDQFDLEMGNASSPLATDGVDLFVGDGNQIKRYSPEGEFLGVHTTLPGSGDIFFMHRDPKGNFYTQVGGTKAYRIDPLGIITPLPTVPELYSVVGGTEGRYYMSSRRFLYTFAADGSQLDRQRTPFDFSGDLAIDHNTDLLFLLDQTGGVATYDANDNPPVLQHDFDVPLDLALYSYFDPYSRNLFVSGLNAVLQLEVDGELRTSYQLPGLSAGGVTVFPTISSPEPSATGMLGLGAILLLGRLRRRANRRSYSN